jgi:hypothetical protein
MFQYAFGKALALRSKREVAFDTDDFKWYSRHGDLQLREAVPNLEQASRRDLVNLLGWQNRRLARRYRLYKRWVRAKTILEPHYQFSEACYKGGDDRYYVGYWQSERYFADCADIIRADFLRQTPDFSAYGGLVEEIQATDSVAIHIRRGDYVSNWAAKQTMAPCGAEYYALAIATIANAVKAPRYFVFSDEHDAIDQERLIPVAHTKVRAKQRVSPYTELRLMRECKHFIVANSTFSWWAAWLGHAGKTVVAPNAWFRDSRRVTQDLIPPSWQRVG